MSGKNTRNSECGENDLFLQFLTNNKNNMENNNEKFGLPWSNTLCTSEHNKEIRFSIFNKT